MNILDFRFFRRASAGPSLGFGHLIYGKVTIRCLNLNMLVDVSVSLDVFCLREKEVNDVGP